METDTIDAQFTRHDGDMGMGTNAIVPRSDQVPAAPAGENHGLVRLAASVDTIIAEFEGYQRVIQAVINDSDFTWIEDKRNKTMRKFPNKSYFDKLAICFGVSTERKEKLEVRDADGRLLRVEYIMRAITPDGSRRTEGTGVCSIDEERFNPRDRNGDIITWLQAKALAKAEHDLLATAECVPLRARILTRSGFKHAYDLAVGDLVLAYDLEADRTAWTPLQDVSVYPDTPTIVLSSQAFRAECTPNHTWAVHMRTERVRTAQRRLIEADGFGKTNSLVLAAAGPEGDLDITPEEASILGWMLTDGHIRFASWSGPRIHIDQSKPRYVEELRQLLGSAASESVATMPPRTFPSGRTYPVKPSHRFAVSKTLSGPLLEKARIAETADIPLLVPHLTRPARQAMMNAMLKGDGTRHGNTWVFNQRPGPVLDAFRMLCALEGIALGKPYVADQCVRQTLRLHRHSEIRALSRLEGPRQAVWCPTTEYGTWVMELDGQVMITGNTRARNRAYSALFGRGVVSAEEVQSGAVDVSTAPAVEEKPTAGQRRQEEPQRASPDRPVTANQLATIAKLSRLLNRDDEGREDMTSAEASEVITRLSRELNESKDKAKAGAPA